LRTDFCCLADVLVSLISSRSRILGGYDHPDVAARLRAVGAGNLSAAIASATALVRDREGSRAALPAPPRGSYPHEGGVGAVGRPRLGPEARRRTCVKLLPAVASQLRAFGDGNLSVGIEKVSIAVTEGGS